MNDEGWILPTPASFRLAPTVLSHGAFQCPPFHWDPDGARLHRVLRLPGLGARTVTVEEEMVERVEVVRDPSRGARPTEVRRAELRLRTPGWSPEDDARMEVEEAVVFMLALDRDLHAFHELCRSDPSLSRIPEMGAGRLLRCPDLWEELAKAICSSHAPWERAVSMIEGLARLGEAHRDRHAWPTPERVLDAGEARLRTEAGLADRAAPVLELAQRIESGALDPAPAEAGLLDRHALADLFDSVSGIGGAAAGHLLLLYGHADHLPLDETMVTFLRDRHFGGRTPPEDEIRARYERYGEWRALALWLDFVQEVWWPTLGAEFR